jgi:eukaryotic-like serine/threonine-protein kinase
LAAIATGTIIAQRYRLDQLIGQGGMGQVWAATHLVTDKRCALKFLKLVRDPRPEARGRFLREARAASRVEHPNVIKISDVFDFDEQTPVMVMELLEGESLAALLARDETLDAASAAAILLPVVSAVGSAHATGVIHRDLKPDNIFLVRGKQGAERVRVLDFGVAKLVDQGPKSDGITTVEGHVVGTPAYMSPEQCLDEVEVDHRTDIWALGVVLYEVLSGVRPVEGSNMAQIVKSILSEGITPLGELAPDVPEDLNALVMRMLAREAALRPADLRDVAEVLAKYVPFQVPSFDAPGSRPHTSSTSLDSASAVARPVAVGAPSDSAHSLPGRRPAKSAFLSLAAAAVVGVAFTAYWLRKPAPPPEPSAADRPAPSIVATSAPEPPASAAPSTVATAATAVPSIAPSASQRPEAPPPGANIAPRTAPVASSAAPSAVAATSAPPAVSAPPPTVAPPPPPDPAPLPTLIEKAPF